MALSEDFAHSPNALLDPTEERSFHRTSRWRRQTLRLGIAAAVVIGLSLATVATIRSGWSRGDDPSSARLTAIVHPQDLVITVTEQGSLESASNVDIKSKVTGQTTILSIVKDGSLVKEGDELIRLDSSTIEDQINAQTITFETAKAAKIEAENNFEAAKMAVREYEEGTFLQELEVAKENVTVAMENLRSAENTYQHTQRMARKGYVTALQRDAHAFAVERSKLDLNVAKKAQEVLEEFTKPKTLSGLKTTRDTAEAKMRSAEAAHKLEDARLTRLQDQLKECVITAPSDGRVIYANEMSWRGNQPQVIIEEGATIRERQSILKLPDLSQMQAKVAIHESRVEQVKEGMPARIRSQEREFHGHVTFVANQPDTGNWFSGSVKKYTTYVHIDDDPENLIPGMTAEVEILIAERQQVLSVPTQSVFELGDKYYCWVDGRRGPERRQVERGMANLTQVEITKGLADGEVVLLDPRSVESDGDSLLTHKSEKVDVKKRFGDRQAGGVPVAGATENGQRRRGNGGGPPGGASPGEGAGGREGGQRRGAPSFATLDADGDKKITREEARGPLKDAFDMVDANGDGFIDNAEFTKAVKAFQSGQGGQGGPGGGGGVRAAQ